MDLFLNGRIEVTTGDITRLKADAIVNAANSSLMGGGGVDGAIHRAGGPRILEECRVIRETTHPGGLPAGEAVITTGGDLPSPYVIHTVGPVWHGGGKGEPEILARAYESSLAIAAERKFDAVAFPAISTGVYGYPKDRAARAAYETVRRFLGAHEYPRKVVFVFFSEQDRRGFLEAIEG